MLWQSRKDLVIPVRHWRFSLAVTCGANLLLCLLALGSSCKVHAQTPAAPSKGKLATEEARCLPDGKGYLKARLSGALQTELDWGNEGTDCTGAVRPTDGGIRMRFSRAMPSDNGSNEARLVLVFGIANLREGASARTLPVNLTVIKEGAGEFYSTQGDDKCMLDQVKQEPIVGMPYRSRVYRIVARGFCTEPARAVRGNGSVLVSRFDYAGRVDFESDDKVSDEAVAAGHKPQDGASSAPPTPAQAPARQPNK